MSTQPAPAPLTVPQAFAHQEGFYQTGRRPQRNHSPGDLIAGDEATRFGAVAEDGRFAVFPSDAVGWKALIRWLSVPAIFSPIPIPGVARPSGPRGYLVRGYLGATMEQVIYRFAPPEDGNATESYVEFVCKNTGHARTDVLTADMLQTPEAVG